MKTKTLLLIIVVILLASCVPVPTPAPIITLAPLATNTLLPTETFTPEPTSTVEPTATITPVVIPDYMNEFIEKGYDAKTSEAGTQYMVGIEGTTKFSSESGILFGNIKIYSWLNVAYFDENHVLQQGIVLNDVCRINGENKGRFTSQYSYSVNLTNNCPSLAYFKGINQDFEKMFQGNTNIVLAYYIFPPKRNRELVFDGVFPVGNTQPVDIPEIGKVLPVVWLELVNPIPAK